MDSLGLSIYNDIYDRFMNKINRIAQTTNINCNIDIRRIETSNIVNCNLLFSNKCIKNETTTFTLLLQSIAEVLLLLPIDQRSEIERKLGVSVDDLIDENDVGFIQTCKTEASVSNTINIDSLTLENCFSSDPVDFVFLNAGSVDANCGMKIISNALKAKDTSNTMVKYSLKYLFNLSLFDYVLIFVLIFISYIIYLFISFYIYNNQKIIYKSRNTILNKDDEILKNINLRYMNDKKYL